MCRRLQPGPRKNFQPIRDRSFNKKLGVRTSSEIVLFFWFVTFDPKFFADNCGLNDDDRDLPHFVRDRILDLHNTGQSLKNLESTMQMKCHATPQRACFPIKLSHPRDIHERRSCTSLIFVSLVAKIFLRGCKKKRFFTASEKFRSNYKSYLWITW